MTCATVTLNLKSLKEAAIQFKGGVMMGIIEWLGVSTLYIIGCKLADKASDKNGKNKTMSNSARLSTKKGSKAGLICIARLVHKGFYCDLSRIAWLRLG